MLTLDFWTFCAIGNLLIGFIGIIPMVLNLKYSIQFKIWDYFLLFLYFIVFGPYELFFEATSQYGFPGTFWPYNIWTEPLFLYVIANICESIPLYLITIRYKWAYPPFWAYLLIGLPVSFTIIDILVNDQVVIFNFALSYWFIWSIRVLIYSIIAYIYFTGNLMVPTKRALHAKQFWSISTSFIAIGMFLLMCQPLFGALSDPNAVIVVGLAMIFFDSAFVLLLTLHIFFPEAILLSDEKILNSNKIYKKIDTVTKPTNILTSIGINILKSYIEDLPPEIKEEIYQ